MKEYGGYLEYERYGGREYYPDGIPLNCGRNCLHYLIECRQIRKISLPYFLCDSVSEVCRKAGVYIRYYHIDNNFLPVLDYSLEEEEYLYIVNFYGQLKRKYLVSLKERYSNFIVDNAQAFFDEPLQHTDTIYVLRKYFGVADGAYLVTDACNSIEYPIDISFERMGYLLGRFEGKASDFYKEYKENEEKFRNLPIMRMSVLTHNLLRGINYDKVKQVRRNNFLHLHERLGVYNRLELTVPPGAFMYPLLVKNGSEIREKLQQQKIYIPMLWPNVLENCGKGMLEYDYASNILPLPVDQRYDLDDMEYIVEMVKKAIL